MSLPSTGRYSATVAGDMKLTFDGQTWSGSFEGFEEFILPCLAWETERHQGTHRTVDVVAKSVLDALFPDGWTETACSADRWLEALPPGAED